MSQQEKATQKLTENIGLEVFDFSTDSTQAFVNGVAGMTNSNMHKIDKAIHEKNSYNGISGSNFNFIKNGVIPDGLTYVEKDIVSDKDTGINVNLSDDFTIAFEFFAKRELGENAGTFLINQGITSSGGFTIGLTSSNFLRIGFSDGASWSYATSTRKINPGKHFFKLIKSNGLLKLESDVDNLQINCSTIKIDKVNTMNIKTSTIGIEKLSICIYNRPLTPQEIARNFSVLNNLPALKTTEITDTQGNKSTLLFSSDEDHIEMATGRALREEYMGVLSAMGKEFTANLQGNISVQNGVKARLISAEIQGQTVKNELISISSTNTPWTIDGAKYIYGGGTYSSIRGITFNANLVIGKEYTIVAHITQNTIATTGTNIFFIGDSTNLGSVNFIPISSSGLIKKKIIPSATNGLVRMGIDATAITSGTLTIEGLTILEGDWTNKQAPSTIFTRLGLSSTQAVISNNNQSYEIYEPQIIGKTRILDADTGLVPTDPTLPSLKDGDVLDLATKTITFANKTTRVLTDEEVKGYYLHRKLIFLGGGGGTNDALDIKEDGRGVLTKKTYKTILDGNVSGVLNRVGTEQYLTDKYMFDLEFPYDSQAINKPNDVICKSDNFKTVSFNARNLDEELISFTSNRLRLTILSSRLASADIEGLSEYLSKNPIKVEYQLATPIITIIDKSIMPAIATDEINNLSAGGDVQASSFKATVPIDKVSELEKELAEIKAIITSKSNLPLQANYINDEYEKCLEDISNMNMKEDD